MRATPLLIGCVLLASCAHATAPAPARDAMEEATKAELLRLETALNEGVLHRDRPALEQILGVEFGLSLPDRAAAPRKDWLYNVQKSITLSSYKITDAHVLVWGKTAIVQTQQHFDDYKAGDRVLPPDATIIDLWTYREGRWQLVRRLSDSTQQRYTGK